MCETAVVCEMLGAVLAGLTIAGMSFNAYAAGERDFNAYPPHVIEYLKRVNHVGQGRYAFRPDYPGGFTQWRKEAHAELGRLLRLDKIAEQAPDFKISVELGAPKDLGSFTRQSGAIETEPSVKIPFFV